MNKQRAQQQILLIVGGSIAAYKSLDLVRQLRSRDYGVTAILTSGGAEFITPLSLSSLSGNPTYTDLFSLKDETEMGHIRLARDADLVLFAPATADMMAKMAHGLADDLAGAVYLALGNANIPVLVAPAMNPHMWQHPTVKRNKSQLKADGITFIEPAEGLMACGETGTGRLEEIEVIADHVERTLTPNISTSTPTSLELLGKHIIVTAGATREPIDPVRFISNYSSGKQSVAIASELVRHGAKVTLLHGAMSAEIPGDVTSHRAMDAEHMYETMESLLPADAVICAAAISDWQCAAPNAQKMKKRSDEDKLTLQLIKTPDILQHVSNHPSKRPSLVVGFAAETEQLVDYAQTKLDAKGCDWILANNVADGAVFGHDDTNITLISKDEVDIWGLLSKQDAASRLCSHIIRFFNQRQPQPTPSDHQEIAL